jgi:hypothetical protein
LVIDGYFCPWTFHGCDVRREAISTSSEQVFGADRCRAGLAFLTMLNQRTTSSGIPPVDTLDKRRDDDEPISFFSLHAVIIKSNIIIIIRRCLDD